MENWVTEEMKECDIKKNTIRANRADLETANGSLMSVETQSGVLIMLHQELRTGSTRIPLTKDRFIGEYIFIDYQVWFMDFMAFS